MRLAWTRLVPIKVGRSRDILHYTLKVEPTELLTDQVQGKRAIEVKYDSKVFGLSH